MSACSICVNAYVVRLCAYRYDDSPAITSLMPYLCLNISQRKRLNIVTFWGGKGPVAVTKAAEAIGSV